MSFSRFIAKWRWNRGTCWFNGVGWWLPVALLLPPPPPPMQPEFDWFNAVVLATLLAFDAVVGVVDDDIKWPFPLSQCLALFDCCLARRLKPKIGINWCCRVVNRRYDFWKRQWHTIICLWSKWARNNVEFKSN